MVNFTCKVLNMITNRELFLSLPRNKPPFIGIAYERENSHGTLEHQDILSDTLEIDLYIFFKDDKLDIRMEVIGFSEIRFYSDVIYDHAKLNNWLVQTKDAERVNFGHVRKDHGGIRIERSFVGNKLFYKPLRNLYIMNLVGNKAIRYLVS
jgi:hypothetical protein